jgi:glycosyltransferase involved in cell wall biosynthesis
MTAFLSAFTSCKPLVITFHGSDVNKTPSDGIIKDFTGRLLSNLAAFRASVLICVSRGVKNNLWWKQDIVEIIPCGINIEEFHLMDKRLARLKLGWEEDEKVVLFNANNPKVKRLDIALKTIDIVKKYQPEARLQILCNVEPRLIPFYINASDCLLICSDSEGNPMIVREALACNLPIVGIDVGDIAEVLKDIRCTYIVSKDPQSLADAIRQVFICGTLSDGRKQVIDKKLTEMDIADEIYSAYKKTLKTDS